MPTAITDKLCLFFLISLILLSGCGRTPQTGAADGSQAPPPPDAPGDRPFVVTLDGTWIGNAISYGPFRDGQHPGGPGPSREELREDLALMGRHWSLLRVYGAAGVTEDLLAVIQEDGLPMKVMVGAWIAVEEQLDEAGNVIEVLPETQAANQLEVDTAIRLSRQYPDIVRAISVGNETQVYWTGHRSRPEVLIRYLRQARTATTVPVTTADDFNFWNKPESNEVAAEIDFITLHMHPLWNGIQLEAALDWTRDIHASILAAHPTRTVIIGENGWATSKHTEGEQGELIKGIAGEPQQRTFYRQLRQWAQKEQVTTFFFEAFDENWKGGEDHPAAVEKHWGLFRADRTPKLALRPGD